jgi:ABC-type branched-subunit amino acid transport system permease subunit
LQSVFGPLAGALGLKILEWLVSRQWPVYWPLFLGTFVFLVIVLLPYGFVGLVEGRRWRTRSTIKA